MQEGRSDTNLSVLQHLHGMRLKGSSAPERKSQLFSCFAQQLLVVTALAAAAPHLQLTVTDTSQQHAKS